MATVTSQTESYLRSIISRLETDEQLPSERTVMKSLSVSRSTIRLVFTKLKAEKVVYAVHGSGYYKS